MLRGRLGPLPGTILSLLLLIVATLVVMPPSNAAGEGQITGTVRGPEGPLGDVWVTAYKRNLGAWEIVDSGLSLSDGTYEINGLDPTTYRVGFENIFGNYAREYYEDATDLDDAADVVVTGTGPTAGIDALLGASGAVAGTVTGPGGAPLEGVRVLAHLLLGDGYYENTGPVATTGGDGTYLLDTLREGTYRIGFKDPSGANRHEFWNNAPSLSVATDIRVRDGQVAQGIDAELAPPVVLSTPPSISGVSRTGATLTADPGSWTPSGASYRYQWLQDNRPVPGATSRTYTPKANALGKVIKVRVTASKPSFSDEEATSAPTKPVARGVIVCSSAPKVTGQAKIGKTLSVSKGTWAPGTARVTYQWLVNGKAVQGATKSNLKVTRTMKGQRLTVRVKATAPGYAPKSVQTKPSGKVV